MVLKDNKKSVKAIQQPRLVHKLTTENTSIVVGIKDHKEVSENKAVPYIQIEIPNNDQLAQIIYRDADTKKQLAKSEMLRGKAGSQIHYSTDKMIKRFLDKGYSLKNNGFDPAEQVNYFDNNDKTTQTFYVDLISPIVKSGVKNSHAEVFKKLTKTRRSQKLITISKDRGQSYSRKMELLGLSGIKE